MDLQDVHLDFRGEHPVFWATTLFGPLVVTAILLGFIGFVAGWGYLHRLVMMALASLWLFGRFIILGGADPDVASVASDMSSFELFAMVFYLDVATASVLAFHLGFLFQIPWLGPKIRILMYDGQFILSHQPWIRRMTFLGLVMFVSFPLAATGSIGGSIFGRLLGLGRVMTFIGIVLGSLVGDGIMLMTAEVIGEHLDKNHPLVKYGGVALVLIIILLLEWRYRRLRNRYLQVESGAPEQRLTPHLDHEL
ncbi:MAG: small multi-drug export protein [Planctomycetaceae bacterium]|nr:small multi-drug export protein [Planctomycetaceae bacterium]